MPVVFKALPLISSCVHKEQSDLTCPPTSVPSSFQNLELAFPVFILTESGFLVSDPRKWCGGD